MADSTITVQGVILYDRWPGTPIKPPIDYSEMTATAVGHNVAYAQYPVGWKWEVYCKGDPADQGTGYNLGFSTFVYLKGAADFSTAVAAAVTVLCVPDETIAAGDAGDILYTMVCDSDSTTHETMGPVAMCLSAMTNSYYGWFWCGGVCPVEYVDGLETTSTLVTDDSVVASCELATVASAATGIALAAQAQAAAVPSCGYALYVDGT